MKSLQELNALANRDTWHRRRAEAMGFTFLKIEVVYDPKFFGAVLRGKFQCVCGRIECFMNLITDFDVYNVDVVDEILNPASWLTRHGSFSREHLKEDGYTEEQITEIEAKAAAFESKYPRW